MTVAGLRIQHFLNGRQYLFLRRKPLRPLLRYAVLSHPDREFAPTAYDEFRLYARLLLDQRCRTGSARTVVSNLAVADAHALHEINPSTTCRPSPMG